MDTPAIQQRLSEIRKSARIQRARHRRCFWAWPLFHIWKLDTHPTTCVLCGKTTMSDYGTTGDMRQGYIDSSSEKERLRMTRKLQRKQKRLKSKKGFEHLR